VRKAWDATSKNERHMCEEKEKIMNRFKEKKLARLRNPNVLFGLKKKRHIK